MKNYDYTLPARMLLPNMVTNIFAGFQLFVFFVCLLFVRYLFVKITYLYNQEMQEIIEHRKRISNKFCHY